MNVLSWVPIAALGVTWAAFQVHDWLTTPPSRRTLLDLAREQDQNAPQTPAGGEPPVTPRTGESSHLPGPTAHGCRLARRIDVGQDGCIHLLRVGYGWQKIGDCQPLPTPDQWDTWAAMLAEEDT